MTRHAWNSLHTWIVERISKQWLVSPSVACVSHILRFRHDLVEVYLRLLLLHHRSLSLDHLLLHHRVEHLCSDLAWQVMGAEQDVHIISVENPLELLVHGINLQKTISSSSKKIPKLYLRSYLATKAKLWWRTLSSQGHPCLDYRCPTSKS